MLACNSRANNIASLVLAAAVTAAPWAQMGKTNARIFERSEGIMEIYFQCMYPNVYIIMRMVDFT